MFSSESGRNTNLFRIDAATGDVRTVRSIDRELHGGEFVISVLAVLRAGDQDNQATRTSSCQVRHLIKTHPK